MMEEKIAAILKWDRAEAAAQNQTQQVFLPQQGPILLEKLAKKKKKELIFKVEC